MQELFMYLWQLPQNLVGLFVILFSKAKYNKSLNLWETKYCFGVSLGKYIVLNRCYTWDDVLHEGGHQLQSEILGWLYLPTVGLLSACGNLWDRWFHKSWTNIQRINWYYNLPWEHWADKLGGVER